jgi:3-oxoacyl-[acyl-carrier-protein] synthase-1
MRRVVITGLGIVSPIGNNFDEVTDALKAGRSGIAFEPEYAENGFRSRVAGIPKINPAEHIDKRHMRFMGTGAGYNYLAMEQAIADSGLEETEVSNLRTGLIMGSGGPSTANFHTAFDVVKNRGGPKRMGPFMVTRCMSSAHSATLATPFKIKGLNYSITSACATSAHCIGNAMEQIQLGKQDVVFAGGGEEVHWSLSCLFDAMNAMSSKYNDTPETASRPYDANRDGFVIAGGGGVLVLEELEHAKARGAKIYAEMTGYGATSDGAGHGGPLRRGWRALYASSSGHVGSRSQGELHQRPWHLYPSRRCDRSAGRAEYLWPRINTADLLDQILDWPLFGRHLGTRSHLFAVNDAK